MSVARPPRSLGRRQRLGGMSRLSRPDRPHHVPSYPGPLPKKPPEPPKFLVTTEESEEGNQKQVVKIRGVAPTRPKGVSDDPVVAKLSSATTSRDFSSPPHHYPQRMPYQVPSDFKSSKKKSRDSRYDTKEVHRSSILVDKANQEYGNPLPLGSSVPKLPTIPRPFVPPPSKDYAHLPKMHQRTAGGKILGGTTRRFVPAEYVPYYEPPTETQEDANNEYNITENENELQYQVVVDAPVGPDNPMKELNDTWMACWDGEAGAVYYYNKITGEATWIPPSDLANCT